MKFALGKIETLWEKRRCWLPPLSPFPIMFSKVSHLTVLKVQYYLERASPDKSQWARTKLILDVSKFLWYEKFNPSPNKLWFYVFAVQVFWKHCRKRSNFTFSHIIFYPFGELSAICIKFKIVDCIPFQFGIVKNLLFGKGVLAEGG